MGKRSLSGDELVGRLPGNSAILFSCSKGQQAREHENAAGGHGVFFAQVIEGLRGGAAEADTGEVDWEDLVGYVRKRTNRLARELFPDEARLADQRFSGNLQNPQHIMNLVARPILARYVRPREPVMPRPADVPERKVTGLDTITTRTAGITLKRIPAGKFQMGSPDGAGEEDERPLHDVRITRPFYLGVTEVTQAQYKAVMGNNPSDFSATGASKDKVAGQSTGQHPVERVSWLDAVKFCNRLSEMEGRKPFYVIAGGTVRVLDWKAPGYRLPTEAEWEYACGGDPADLKEHAWNEDNSASLTHPVGQKLTNRFGLHDMLGNVWEWCWDAYDVGYYKQSPSDYPTGPDATEAAGRVIRGGGWNLNPRYCRSASRYGDSPGDRNDYLGFRLALVQ